VHPALAKLSDRELICRVQDGQPDLFAVLFRRYQSQFLRVAEGRLGRRDWAEDVVQETFMAAFQSRMSFRIEGNLRSWLWTILLNQCTRHYQRRSRSPRVQSWAEGSENPSINDSSPEDPPDREPAPPMQLLAKERKDRLEVLLEELSQVQADALRLRFYAGLKFREIAEAMECSLATAKNRVRWGLLQLSERTFEEQTLAPDDDLWGEAS
jgi:RNA polymerase sigma-70 factor (ECF subfamily)